MSNSITADEGETESGHEDDNDRSSVENVKCNTATDDQSSLQAGSQKLEMNIKQEQTSDAQEFGSEFCTASPVVVASLAVSPCCQYYQGNDHQPFQNYPYHSQLHQQLGPNPEVSWSGVAAAYIPAATSASSTLPTMPWMPAPSMASQRPMFYSFDEVGDGASFHGDDATTYCWPYYGRHGQSNVHYQSSLLQAAPAAAAAAAYLQPMVPSPYVSLTAADANPSSLGVSEVAAGPASGSMVTDSVISVSVAGSLRHRILPPPPASVDVDKYLDSQHLLQYYAVPASVEQFPFYRAHRRHQRHHASSTGRFGADDEMAMESLPSSQLCDSTSQYAATSQSNGRNLQQRRTEPTVSTARPLTTFHR